MTHTDEEILIDGVNVARCTYFQQEDDEYTCGAEECNGAVVGCRACDNCYYKQLKRLEQENAELKADLKSLEYTVALRGKRDIDNAADLFAKHIAKIESENSILKAENAELNETIDSLLTIQYAIAANATKLEQTLNAVKVIIENRCWDYTDITCIEFKDKILDLIKESECE